MKKNTLLALTLTALVSSGLVACDLSFLGGGQTADQDFKVPANGFNTSKEVKITFYSTMGDSLQQVFNAYLAEFNELYPNIIVEHSQPGGYDQVRDQISTELIANSHPNIAYCYPDHVALYNLNKAVIQLDNVIADSTYGLTQDQIDDFIPGYYEEGRQFGDGKMYSLPFSKSTEVLYYNKSFFDENELDVPTNWTEMASVMRAIKEIDPECTPLGYDSESNWFITMCEQMKSGYTTPNAVNTSDHFIFNNTTNKSFMTQFKSWYDEGLITTQQILGTYSSSLFVSTTGKRSYMSIGSSAGATHQAPTADESGEYPFEVGIAPIPQYDENNQKVISQGPSICIFADTDPQKVMASWLLLKYFTTNVEFQAAFSMASGYVPVLKSVNTIEAYKDHLDSADGYATGISALAAKVCAEQVDNYFTSPAFMGSSAARTAVQNLFLAVMNDTDIDIAFNDAITYCIENS